MFAFRRRTNGAWLAIWRTITLESEESVAVAGLSVATNAVAINPRPGDSSPLGDYTGPKRRPCQVTVHRDGGFLALCLTGGFIEPGDDNLIRPVRGR